MSYSIIFCSQCGSRKVDVRYWQRQNAARVSCAECGNEATLTNFTLGRVAATSFEDEARTVGKAIRDIAEKRVVGEPLVNRQKARAKLKKEIQDRG